MAQALTRQHETARLLASFLVVHTNDRDLADCLERVLASFVKLPSLDAAVNELVGELEAERAKFVDPNHPGE